MSPSPLAHPHPRRGPGRLLGVLAAALSFLRPMPLAAEPVVERVGDGVVRVFPSLAAKRQAMPSVALVAPLDSLGPAASADDLRPVFETFRGYRITRFAIPHGTSLYGTGEVGGPLLRNGRRTYLWNTDAYDYRAGTDTLYQSHPWVLGVRPDGSSFGVLFDTIHRAQLDLAGGIRFAAEGPWYGTLVIARPTPHEVLRVLADLTGHLPMPPRWALGFHQCRFSYTPAARALEVAAEFRRRRLPCDALWLDIDYMRGFRCFTFDPDGFPDPRAFTDALHRQGFRVVTILDPGLKAEPGYAAYDAGQRQDAWVRTREGTPYVAPVWPGDCVFPDFTHRGVRSWWAGLHQDFVAHGVDGIWNDMNEPAVFKTRTRTMPLDNWHRADDDLGGPGPHARYHNVYGMLMTRATREGLLAARPERRPFVLTRASHLGGQRYAATWTGDNTADWAHLKASIPMALNLGLSGQPFAGPDIGGFSRDGDGALFARWMGIGTLLPFARAHTAKGNRDKEPWAFGAAVEATCRRALERRARLLPHLYTLFHEAHVTGLPVARPLFFADPADPRLRAVDSAFLLGEGLLVAAAVEPDARPDPTRPRGVWRRIDLGVDDADDPDLPALHLAAGTILPLGPVIQHDGERPLDPLELVVVLDDDGRAAGTLYEDAGDGYAHERGGYALTRFEALREGGMVTVTARRIAGDLDPPARTLVVRVVGAHDETGGSAPGAGPLRVRAPR